MTFRSHQARGGAHSVGNGGVSRRAFVAASVALSATLGMSRQRARAQGTPAAEGPWSFTDDRGRTIELPARPTRIVSEVGVGAALWDFGIHPIGVYGATLEGQDGKPATVVGRMDLDQVEFVGVDMEALDLEKIVSLDPEVLVGTTWEPDDPNDFGGYDEGQLGGLPEIAPTLAIRVIDAPVDVPLARFAELAAVLGADLHAPEVVEARAAFDAACDEVREAAAEKPGLKVLAFYAGTDSLYVANPTVASDLMFFAELGVDFVVPTDPGPEMGGYWENLSWEAVNTYQVDLYLLDDRTFSLTPEQVMEMPSFSALPAAVANQIGPWSVEYVISYQGLTTVLLALAESIRNAEVLPK